MNKVILICLLFISGVAFGQGYPNTAVRGNVSTLDSAKGPITSATGVIITAHLDTTTVNALNYFKNRVGATFYSTSDNTIYTRTTAYQWVAIGSGGGGGSTDTTVVKLPCYVKQTVGQKDTLICPIDSLIAAAGIGSGISELGNGYGLIKVNDSTYRIDTTAGYIATQWYVDSSVIGKYIPLSGTEVGKPVTGDVEFEAGPTRLLFSDDLSTSRGEIGIRRNVIRNKVTETSSGRFNEFFVTTGAAIIKGTDPSHATGIEVNPESITISSDYETFAGISGSADFTPNIGPLDYTQKKYVDSSIAQRTVQSITAGTGGITITGTTRNPVINGTGGGGGSAKAYAPLVVRNDSIYQRFNVLAYGADPTGTNDATAAIQSAINAADAAGGGIVLIPTGIFKIAGARNGTTNSQLYIPYRAYSDTLRGRIIIQGEGNSLTPNGGGLLLGAATPATKTGSILYSTIATGVAGFAVIGTSGTPNAQTLEIRDIGILIKNNPSGTGPVVGGISWKNGANFIVDRVTVSIDTSGYRSVAPQLDITGIESPDDGYGEIYSISNTQVAGMRSGYKIGEHVQFNNANALTCYYGVFMKQGTHISSAPRLGLQWCAIPIYVSQFCTLSNWNVDMEWQQIGKWYDYTNTVRDTANVSTGIIYYDITNAGGGDGSVTNFSKNGGSKLFCYRSKAGPLGNPISVAGGATSYTDIISNFGSLNTATIEVNANNTSTSSDTYFPTLNMVVKQNGTANAAGALYFANTAIAAADKRLGFISVLTDGATNSGSYVFGTNNAGSLGVRMTIKANGRVGIGNPSPTEALDVTGNIILSTAGNKLKIATGTNASVGTATLVAGTVTVATTAAVTASKIFVTVTTPGGVQGFLSVPTIVNGTSFTITSSSAAETSLVNWWIIN